MDEVAERYLRLGLGLGKHVDGLVDGYYGPPELAESDPQSLEELLEEARMLRGTSRWPTSKSSGGAG